MSTFAFVFLCIQACLVQTVFSQCLGAYPGYAPLPAVPVASPCGYSAGMTEFAYPGAIGFANGYPGAYGTPFGLASPVAYEGLAYPGAAPYGGAGEGNVAVAGELPVAGTTAVAGQVPIMGAVSFGGAIPAGGAVSINGQCACGCGSPYVY